MGTLTLQLYLKYLVRKKGLYQKSQCIKFGIVDWGCCYTTVIVSYFSAAALIFLSLYSYYVLGEEADPYLFFMSNKNILLKEEKVSPEYAGSIHQGQSTNQEHKVQKSKSP